MAAWAPILILAGVLLVGVSARLTKRISAHRPEADRRAPLVLRVTLMVAGGYLIALGFSGL